MGFVSVTLTPDARLWKCSIPTTQAGLAYKPSLYPTRYNATRAEVTVGAVGAVGTTFGAASSAVVPLAPHLPPSSVTPSTAPSAVPGPVDGHGASEVANVDGSVVDDFAGTVPLAAALDTTAGVALEQVITFVLTCVLIVFADVCPAVYPDC